MNRNYYLSGDVTHEEYYAQFVCSGVRHAVKSFFKIGDLREAYKIDEHFNTIPLAKWDIVANYLTTLSLGLSQQMNEAGDSLTLPGLVCIAKEAARQIIDES